MPKRVTLIDEYKKFPCDICGSRDATEVPYARVYMHGQPVHICKKCGFVYVQSRRSAETIAESWSKELFNGHYTAKIPAVKARQVYVGDFIDVSIGLKGKKVCDIGAGEGQFLEIIRKDYGAYVFGIEPSKENCTKLSKLGIKFFRGTIEEFDAHGRNKYYHPDIVTIMWAMETCVSCRRMLSVAYDVLKDKGHIVVATGSRILVPFKKPLFLYFNNTPADTNAFRFSDHTLRKILGIAGFEVTHVNRYLDSDVLCMIARKVSPYRKINYRGDDYKEVYNFFKRWHRETLFYKNNLILKK